MYVNSSVHQLARNIESAYFLIAKVRQSLLEREQFTEWKDLLEASALLDSNQSMLASMLISQESDPEQPR